MGITEKQMETTIMGFAAFDRNLVWTLESASVSSGKLPAAPRHLTCLGVDGRWPCSSQTGKTTMLLQE